MQPPSVTTLTTLGLRTVCIVKKPQPTGTTSMLCVIITMLHLAALKSLEHLYCFDCFFHIISFVNRFFTDAIMRYSCVVIHVLKDLISNKVTPANNSINAIASPMIVDARINAVAARSIHGLNKCRKLSV